MPPDAPMHVVPFGWLLAITLGGLAAIIGGVVTVLHFLKKMMHEEISTTISSEAFEKRVRRIFSDLLDAKVMADIKAIQKRQEDQAKSIVSAHRRVDDLYKLKGLEEHKHQHGEEHKHQHGEE